MGLGEQRELAKRGIYVARIAWRTFRSVWPLLYSKESNSEYCKSIRVIDVPLKYRGEASELSRRQAHHKRLE